MIGANACFSNSVFGRQLALCRARFSNKHAGQSRVSSVSPSEKRTPNPPSSRRRGTIAWQATITCAPEARRRRNSQLRKGAWLTRSFTLSTTCRAVALREGGSTINYQLQLRQRGQCLLSGDGNVSCINTPTGDFPTKNGRSHRQQLQLHRHAVRLTAPCSLLFPFFKEASEAK